MATGRGGDTGGTGAAAAPARRGLLRGMVALAALGAGGCGFQPLYGDGSGPAAAAGDAEIAAELAAIRIGLIPERFGQLMRRALQQRLGHGGAAAPARWELMVSPGLATEGLGILRDGSATRVRYIGTANWSLLRLPAREMAANGFERAIEAYNIQPNQYFAADLSRDAAERRLADTLADEVVTRLAVRLRDLRATGSPTQLIEPVAPPPTLRLTPPRGGLGSAGMPGRSTGVGGGLQGGIGPADTLR